MFIVPKHIDCQHGMFVISVVHYTVYETNVSLIERPLSIRIGRRSIALLSRTDVTIKTIVVIITAINNISVTTEINSSIFIRHFKDKSVLLP